MWNVPNSVLHIYIYLITIGGLEVVGGGRGGRLQTERYVRIVGRLCLYPYHNNQKFKTFTFISAILFDIDIENVFHLFIKDYTSTLMNLNEKIGGNQCKTRF